MRVLLFCILASMLLMAPAGALEPEDVVVVYHADSVLSTESARRYAAKRHIPPAQVVALAGLGGTGDISRMDFVQKLCLPLLQLGQERGWRWPAAATGGSKRIKAMVLMPDIPLRVGGSAGSKDAHAAVDSELMLLGASFPTAGMLPNPCYNKNLSLSREHPPVMAVCRIDGPDAACVQRMIDDPVRVEAQGLWGWVVIDQGGPYKEGDDWMAEAAMQARLMEQPVFHETSRRTLAEAFPLMQDTAVYLGWYTGSPNGPFNAGTPGGFRFAPGAVAIHLHSFSATSVKNTQVWVAALLSRGAAVTAGNVNEPYLNPSLHFDVFYNRLVKGASVAEAALMATPVLSWQSIVLGDPLYRPFAAMGSTRAANSFVTWKKICREHGEDLPALKRAVRVRERTAEGAALAEMLGWYCEQRQQPKEAYEAFATACGLYRDLRDRTRTAILAATALAADKKLERAQRMLLPWLEAGQGSPYLPALRESYKAVGGKLGPEPPRK